MKKQIIRLTEGDLHNIIKESVNNILMEKRGINSKKLYDILQQHGGLEFSPGNRQRFAGKHFSHSPACLDLHNMTDDDVIGVFDYDEIKMLNLEYPSQEVLDKFNVKLGSADMLEKERLSDGKYLLAILRGGKFDRRAPRPQDEIKDGDFEKKYKKTEQRRMNKPQNAYKWENDKAEDLFKNPYWRNKSGDWSDPKNYKGAMDNVRNGRHFWNKGK